MADRDELLHPLGFLVGTWQGEGAGAVPGGGGPDYPYAEVLRIYDDGSPWLAYSSQVVSAEDGHWIHSEAGWFRDQPADADGNIAIELVLSGPNGVTEVLIGQLQLTAVGESIELSSDVVARTPTAQAITADRRLYAVRGGKLMYAIEVATSESPLAPYLAAALDRIE